MAPFEASAARRRAAAAFGFAASALAALVPLAGACARPGYSHVSQFISELGETGAPNADLVAAAGFAPIGVAVLAFIALAAGAFPRSRRAALGALAFAAVGAAYLAAAISPCDAGCPAEGSTKQAVHNLFGLLEYLGAIAGLLLLRSAFLRSDRWRALAPPCAVAAAGVALGFGAMLAPSLAELRGLSQRVAETSIFLWIAVVSGFITRR